MIDHTGQHTLGATLLLEVACTLHASGLRTGIAETGQIDRQVAYTGGGVNRLTSETVTQLGNDRRPIGTYDRTGNPLRVTLFQPCGSVVLRCGVTVVSQSGQSPARRP